MFIRLTSGYQQGLSMIELLVSMAILSVGLLGIAGLQLNSVQNSNWSYHYSLADSYVHMITERMRSNLAAVNNSSSELDNQYASVTAAPDSVEKNCDSSKCSSTEIAAYDINQWFAAITAELPQGSASIACQDVDDTDTDECSAGSPHRITLQWFDKREDETQSIVMDVIP